MNFDFGEMLVSTWKIGWNHKQLWLIQLLPGIVILAMFPLIFLVNPAFTAWMPRPWNQAVYSPGLISASQVALILLGIAAGLLSALAQAVCMLGALEVDRGAKKLAIRELLRNSLPFFWRVLGLYLLFGAAWGLVIFLIGILVSAISFVALVGVLCAIPLLILFIPVEGIGYVILQFAQAAILAEGLGVKPAIARAVQLFRKNLLAGLALVIFQYFGSSFISGLVTVPVMLPLVVLTFLSIGSNQSGSASPAILMSGLPIAMVLALVIQGILMVFIQAMWAVTYRRLTNSSTGGFRVHVFADEERE